MTYIDIQEEEVTSRENDKLMSLKVVFKSISEHFPIVLKELKKNIKASHEASIPLPS